MTTPDHWHIPMDRLAVLRRGFEDIPDPDIDRHPSEGFKSIARMRKEVQSACSSLEGF